MPYPRERSDDDTLLDLDEENSSEQLENQVQKAQEALLQLKRQQDAIEKQKRELEDLTRRQNELEAGRGEMSEKLTRALVVLEREIYEAQKRVEQLTSTRAAFVHHLDVVESINPKSWDKSDLGRELSRALSAVDDARTEYSKSRSRINAESSGDVLESEDAEGLYEGHEPRDFLYWLKSGFAFTLPLLILGFVILAIIYAKL